MADQVTALDATFLELEEADESAHMHIGGVMIFEPPPGGAPPPLERVRAEVLERLGGMPRYRARLSEAHTGGLRWPEWVPDERFDINRHVFAAGLPEPRGEAELLDWAGDYFSQRLERSRPLWEVVVIELGDGRWAMVTKTHHSMVDGVGSVELAHTLLDDSPEGSTHAPSAPRRPRRPQPQSSLPGTLARGAYSAARGVAGAALHPRETATRSRALAELLIRDEVIAAPHTSLNEPIGTRRSLAVLEVPIDTIREIRGSLGGTLNDVVLAATAGGLRDLLIARGEMPPEAGLRAMVPVNLRTAREHLSLGNKITSLFVSLHVAEPDPATRFRRQVAHDSSLKSSGQGLGSKTMIDIAAAAPPVLHTFLARGLFASRLFNVTVTNVPGPAIPLYAYSSHLVSVWPLVPLAASHAIGAGGVQLRRQAVLLLQRRPRLGAGPADPHRGHEDRVRRAAGARAGRGAGRRGAGPRLSAVSPRRPS